MEFNILRDKKIGIFYADAKVSQNVLKSQAKFVLHLSLLDTTTVHCEVFTLAYWSAQ